MIIADETKHNLSLSGCHPLLESGQHKRVQHFSDNKEANEKVIWAMSESKRY